MAMDGVGFDPDTYEGSPNVEVSHGILVLVASFSMFALTNYLIILVGPPKNIKGDIWRWRNTFVSWLHADVLALGIFFCFWYVPNGFDDLILDCHTTTYSLNAFSLGYFLYDFVDILYYKKQTSYWEVCIHHVVVIATIWHSVYYKVYVPYILIALMTEINSVFLHARKLMQLDAWPFDHWLYRFVIWMNFFTFITCRLAAILTVGWGCYTNWNRITVLYRSFAVVALVIMYLINPVLLWRLFKTDILRFYKGSKGQNGHVKKPHANGEYHSANGFSGNHQS